MKRRPLPLGNRLSSRFRDFSAYVDSVAEEAPSLQRIDPFGAPFEADISSLKVGSLKFVASNASPFRYVDSGAIDQIYIDVTVKGFQKGIVGNKKFNWGNRETFALFSPGDSIDIESSERSFVFINLNNQKIVETIEAMETSLDRKFDRSTLSHSRSISLSGGNINFLNVFEGHFSLVDRCNSNSDLLKNLSFEDDIYRAVILAANPSLIEHGERGPSFQIRRIDDLCDQIRQNPEKWFSKTEMEKIAGCSGRNIQAVFKKRLGLSPMEWQRREKLLSAQQFLTATDEQISTIAHRFSFTSTAKFSSHYRNLFGELPSETRKRLRK